MFSKIKEIKKFTEKKEIDSIIGPPKFQVDDRNVYYYGNGLLIAYYQRCFKINGVERIEYGDEGEYAVDIYHFMDLEMLNKIFDLSSYSVSDVISDFSYAIDDGVSYGKTFAQIHNLKLYREYPDCYMEGETRFLENGEICIRNLFIMYDRYTLYFRGKSKKSKLSGFKYVLSD